MRWVVVAIPWLIGCRLNPECFGTSECPDGTYCVDQVCVPTDPPMPTTEDPLAAVGGFSQVATGYGFVEGPNWMDPAVAEVEGLLFADVLGNAIYELRAPGAVRAIRAPSGRTNGMRTDERGLLLAAELETRSITRMSQIGIVETVVDRFEGNRFNSPNDLAVRLSDGTIYFTDPPLGLDGRPRELPFNGVFRVAPDGTVTAEWRGEERSIPNGIELSPDQATLYVTDSADALIRAFDVTPEGALSRERIFVRTAAEPDGLAPDRDGNLYVATSTGVQVFAENGYHWGDIRFPEQPTNVVFGGDDRATLYVTTPSSVYSATTAIAGTRWSEAGTAP